MKKIGVMAALALMALNFSRDPFPPTHFSEVLQSPHIPDTMRSACSIPQLLATDNVWRDIDERVIPHVLLRIDTCLDIIKNSERTSLNEALALGRVINIVSRLRGELTPYTASFLEVE